MSMNYSLICVNYVDLIITCIKISLYFYLRMIGDVYEGRRAQFRFHSSERSPSCLSLTYHEVQGRSWQHAVFAQKAVRAQTLARSRAGSWNHNIWRQVSVRGSLLPSCSPSVRACIRQHSRVLSWHGTSHRVLTSGIETSLISCAFFYHLQYEIWRFLDCYNS